MNGPKRVVVEKAREVWNGRCKVLAWRRAVRGIALRIEDVEYCDWRADGAGLRFKTVVGTNAMNSGKSVAGGTCIPCQI